MKAEKPLYGSPCNGCGLCCLSIQCRLSLDMFGVQTRCPALMDAGSRYACGLIAQPDRHFGDRAAEAAMAAGLALGIGTYCDSATNAADWKAARRIDRERAAS